MVPKCIQSEMPGVVKLIVSPNAGTADETLICADPSALDWLNVQVSQTVNITIRFIISFKCETSGLTKASGSSTTTCQFLLRVRRFLGAALSTRRAVVLVAAMLLCGADSHVGPT